jgi:hypothetical protein
MKTDEEFGPGGFYKVEEVEGWWWKDLVSLILSSRILEL